MIGAKRSSSGSRTKIRSMSSSTVAVNNDSDSWLGSSGENAGSLASDPSTLCISAVAIPRLPRRWRKAAGSVPISSSASSQPPRASGRNSWATPSVVASADPSYSYQPRSGAMFGKPCCVRNRSTSSSGLTPGSSLRNTFNTSSSSNTIDELDCSTPISRALASCAEVRMPSDRAKVNLPSEVSISSVVSTRRNSSRASDGSDNAS